MDALVTAFVAAALAEWGDKTQLLVAALAARTGRPTTVLMALFAAALVSSSLAAMAGLVVSDLVSIRAMTLLVALALVFGGLFGLIWRRSPRIEDSAMPLFLIASVLLLAAEFGGRSQFLIFALAGRFESVGLATAGAVAGILAAGVPAALLGQQLESSPATRILRYVGSGLFLIVGFVVAMQAFQLT